MCVYWYRSTSCSSHLFRNHRQVSQQSFVFFSTYVNSRKTTEVFFLCYSININIAMHAYQSENIDTVSRFFVLSFSFCFG